MVSHWGCLICPTWPDLKTAATNGTNLMLEGLYQWGTFIYFSANCDAMVVLVLGPCEGAYDDDTTLTDLAAASVLPGLAYSI